MITFRLFLEELEKKPQLKDFIKRSCAKYLSESGGKLMFRGIGKKPTGYIHEELFMNNKQLDAFQASIRRNRKPLTTNLRMHEITDEWFFDKFGIKYRSNALFTTADTVTAKGYGNIAAIFPIGDFKYVWSPEMEDLYFLFNNIDDVELWTESPSDVFKKLDSLNYKDTDLKKALITHNEIMIHCDDYLAVILPDDDDTIKALKNYLF